MSSTNAPFGMRPVAHITGGPAAGYTRALAGGISSAYNTAIYCYQPVKLNDGVLNPAAAGDTFIGVFMGVEYTDSNGRRQVSPQWIANTPATEVVAYYTEDPGIIYELQADGSLAQTSIGDQADFSNATANGSGYSQCTISTSLAGTSATAGLRIIDLGHAADNAWGDTYTVVRATISEHQYVANKNAI